MPLMPLQMDNRHYRTKCQTWLLNRRRDLSQSGRDPGIPGLLKVPIWNQHLKRHVYGPRIWHSRCSGLETFHVLEPCFRTGLPKFTSLLWDETSTWNLHLTFELDETWSLDHMKRPSSWVCLCVCVCVFFDFLFLVVPRCFSPWPRTRARRPSIPAAWQTLESVPAQFAAKDWFAVSWLRAFVCVSTPVSKVFTYLQGAQEPLVSLAPTKTLIIGCVNVPEGTPWAPLCAACVPIRTSIFNPVSLAQRLSDAFDAITNGQQTLKNEMSNMTSQVCAPWSNIVCGVSSSQHHNFFQRCTWENESGCDPWHMCMGI